MFSLLKKVLLGGAVLLGTMPQASDACTNFIISTQDNAIINGRSMEFAVFLPTAIKVVPKGETVQSVGPNNQKGMSWTTKYAYAGIAIFEQGIVIDGLNEQGLSVGGLWFRDGQYPDISKAPASTIMAYTDVIRWLLGNFATTEEAKNALPKINVFTFPIPGIPGGPAPIHLAIHDAAGSSAVMEFIDGKMRIMDNPVGVLTNSPEFTWQLTNLRNYINLTAVNKDEEKLGGLVVAPSGEGSGLLGIPGDWTPPSRFVRAVLYKQFAKKAPNVQEGVNAALHILNAFDIPYGTIRTAKSEGDYTQWVVIKDLATKKLYARTYTDPTIVSVDLNRETAKGAKTIPLHSVPVHY